MRVSIIMTPGHIGRGQQVDITPGARSAAAAILRDQYGEGPFTLTEKHDWATMSVMAEGASIYDANSIWKIIADALEEHGCVTIVMPGCG